MVRGSWSFVSFVSFASALAGLGTAGAACSSPAPVASDVNVTFPPAPLVATTGDHGKLRVEARTSPDQPPPHGVITVELTVTDAATGAPVDALTVVPVPWMPAMGHGTSVNPTVTPMGHGNYVLTNVDLFMPGTWELRTTFSGAVSDTAKPRFDVP